MAKIVVKMNFKVYFETLSVLDFTKDNTQIKNAFNWLKNRQQENGLIDLKMLKGKDKNFKFWICLVICRIFKRLQS